MSSQYRGDIVARWELATIASISDARLVSPAAARALAIINTCMYDAWAGYADRALGTQLGGALRRSASERTFANKEKAVSYAAYRALVDVLPVDTNSVYIPLMKELGYDPKDNSTDIETPAGIGNVACAAVLEFRHHDKSNQLGDLAQGAYSDWSNYRPVNAAGTIPAAFLFGKPLNPEHWQRLTYTDSAGNLVLQMFAGAQWRYVTPFAMTAGDQLRSLVEPGPAKYGTAEYQQQVEELIALSAALDDRQKTIAEYWSVGESTDLIIRQEFQGDETSEFDILGLVDHTHGASAQFFEDAVMRNGLADHGRKDSGNGRDGCRAKSMRRIGACE